MERSYLAYLLQEENTHFPSLHCTTVHFGYGHLTFTPTKLLELHNVFKAIWEAEEICHIFFMGILNHWTCLMVTKNRGNPPVLVYMDSLNRPSLEETDESVDVWLVEEEKRREEQGKKKWTDFYRDGKHFFFLSNKRGPKNLIYCFALFLRLLVVARQSRIDARLALQFFVRCVKGESVIELTFNGAITRFLNRFPLHLSSFLFSLWITGFSLLLLFVKKKNSFKDHVCDIETYTIGEENLELFLSGLVHWLENYWRPQTLRDFLFAELKIFGHRTLWPDVFQRLDRWCLFQFNYEWKHLSIINDFKRVTASIHSVIKSQRYAHGSKI